MSQPVTQSPQYSAHSVHRYEEIFGADFLSSGGLDTTKVICETLGLRSGTRVLDVGCGLGGSAFHMAQVYGAKVTGIDILGQMVEIATHRAKERGIDGVTFVQGDILELELPAAAYDVAYSRDAFLHIEDKADLFRKLHHLVAPGGKLYVTDYARGPDPLGADFEAYAEDTGYDLKQLGEYAAILEEAGFKDVAAKDETGAFVAVLQREIKGVLSDSRASCNGLSEDDKAYLSERWERKIRWCEAGHMKWAHLCARRG